MSQDTPPKLTSLYRDLTKYTLEGVSIHIGASASIESLVVSTRQTNSYHLHIVCASTHLLKVSLNSQPSQIWATQASCCWQISKRSRNWVLREQSPSHMSCQKGNRSPITKFPSVKKNCSSKSPWYTLPKGRPHSRFSPKNVWFISIVLVRKNFLPITISIVKEPLAPRVQHGHVKIHKIRDTHTTKFHSSRNETPVS